MRDLGGQHPRLKVDPYPPGGLKFFQQLAHAAYRAGKLIHCQRGEVPVIGTAEPAGAFARLQLHTRLTQARIDGRCSRSDVGAVEMIGASPVWLVSCLR